jgi:FAD/FMN-containing dehydrogenase
MTGSGEILRCSPTEHADLFRATCGGMGLTGIVMTVRLQLRRIVSSDIRCRTLRLHGLEATLEAFDLHADSTYSVAWIDCFATGNRLGRSVLMHGEHADTGALRWSPPGRRTVPSAFPARLLNAVTIRCFNSLYYHRPLRADSTVSYQPFFYPLDGLRHWNRMYGARGFMQYQFVLPLQSGSAPLRAILGRIARSGLGSFLAVLKRLGPGNDHPLSFPMPGMSLALDFRFDARLLALLTELDAVVDAHGGRVYLTKDARLSVASFRSGYPLWQQFQEIRSRYGALGRFASAQSTRLGLE